MPDAIPGLSIRQPWAWAVLHANKRIENRDWRGCSYRGPIWIHASLWPSGLRLDAPMSTAAGQDALAAAEDMLAMARVAGVRFAEPVTLARLYEHRGCIVGRARVDGVVHNERDFAALAANVADAERQRAWWLGGFGLVLADDVQAIDPVPCKGALGLFRLAEEIEARACAAWMKTRAA